MLRFQVINYNEPAKNRGGIFPFNLECIYAYRSRETLFGACNIYIEGVKLHQVKHV